MAGAPVNVPIHARRNPKGKICNAGCGSFFGFAVSWPTQLSFRIEGSKGYPLNRSWVQWRPMLREYYSRHFPEIKGEWGEVWQVHTGNMLRSLAFLAAFAFLSLSRAAVIVTGADWRDTSGNIIQAHGGGILKVWNVFSTKPPHTEGKYYHRLALLSTGSAKTRRTIVGSSELFLVTL
jgi:hypothetical protein